MRPGLGESSPGTGPPSCPAAAGPSATCLCAPGAPGASGPVGADVGLSAPESAGSGEEEAAGGAPRGPQALEGIKRRKGRGGLPPAAAAHVAAPPSGPPGLGLPADTGSSLRGRRPCAALWASSRPAFLRVVLLETAPRPGLKTGLCGPARGGALG